MEANIPSYKIEKCKKYQVRLKKYTKELAKNKARYEKLIDYTNKKVVMRRITSLEKEVRRHIIFLDTCPNAA